MWISLSFKPEHPKQRVECHTQVADVLDTPVQRVLLAMGHPREGFVLQYSSQGDAEDATSSHSTHRINGFEPQCVQCPALVGMPIG